MTNIIKLNHEDFFSLLEKIKHYSVEKIKSMDINNIQDWNGSNLLFYNFDLELAGKLILAGIDINHKNNNGFNAAYFSMNGKNSFKTLELLIKNGIDIFSKKNNILIHLFKDMVCSNKEEEIEFSKIQILLLSKNKELLTPAREGEFKYYLEHNILSLLTPDTIHYLIYDEKIDLISKKDNDGNNFLFNIINSYMYAGSYGRTIMFEKILKMMTRDEINCVNHCKENVLWRFKIDDCEKIELLKKYSLNFKQLDINNESVLEKNKANQEGHKLNLLLLKYGAELTEKCVIDILSTEPDLFKQRKRWNLEHYDSIFDIAKQQFALCEKEKIEKEIGSYNHKASHNKQRL